MVFRLVKNFQKEYKYTIGEKLKNEAIEMVIQVFKANVARDKKEHLLKARENVEVIRLLIRLLKDLKQIDIKSLADINVKTEEISRQFAGWEKSIK
jgi:uncharacterized protein (UPF0371 family)